MIDEPMSKTDPLSGAVWCEEHQRAECAKLSKRSQERCHDIAIDGTGACRHHVGKSTEQARAEVEARRTLLAAMADAPRLHPGEVLLRAVHAANVLLERLLADIPSEDVTSEQLDLVHRAIDRAGRWAEASVRADAADRWVRAQESVASRDADRVQGLFASALSKLDPPRSWDEPEVRAAFVAALDELAAGEGG